jgi:hypothetical protein
MDVFRCSPVRPENGRMTLIDISQGQDVHCCRPVAVSAPKSEAVTKLIYSGGPDRPNEDELKVHRMVDHVTVG